MAFRRSMIWVVDDDAYMLKILGFKLRKLGYECVLFDSAEQALSAEPPLKLTHVFTDIHLDGKSGVELVQTLKTLQQCQTTVFTAISSNAIEGEKELQMLFDFCLQKPVSDEDLGRALEDPLHFPYLNAMITSEEDKTEIIAHFYEETSRDIASLRQAAKMNNVDDLVLLTHRLAGRLAQFSQQALSDDFRAIEQELLQPGETKDITEMLENTIAGLLRFMARLKR